MSHAEKIKVWDLPVRIFHWSLLVFFSIAYITGEELESLHAYAGYVVIALLVFRLIWGLVGSRYARFSNFIYSPKNVRAYLKSLLSSKPQQYLGHNPAAGVMVLLLLVSLVLTSWSGLQAYAAEGYGPLATTDMTIISSAYADDDHDHENENGDLDGKSGNGEDFWEEVHEFFVNVTLLLVFTHVAGVLVSSLLHGENLVKAMINGYKEKPQD